MECRRRGHGERKEDYWMKPSKRATRGMYRKLLQSYCINARAMRVGH